MTRSIRCASGGNRREGKSPDGLPDDLKSIFKTPPRHKERFDAQALRDYYLSKVCVSTRPTFEPLVSMSPAFAASDPTSRMRSPATFVFRDLDKPQDAFVMRGQYDKPGTRSFLPRPALPKLKERPLVNSDATPTEPPGPGPLAREADQPLTARVTVSRWSQFFGMGIVRTTSVLGPRGTSSAS